MNNFQSLDVVDRVSGTQLQVGENLAVKGLSRDVDLHNEIYVEKKNQVWYNCHSFININMNNIQQIEI